MSEKLNWVDFRSVKARVPVEAVLAHYGLELQAKGRDELVGLCPFHEDKRPSFRMNVEKKAWNCFGCKRHGGILEFVSEMEQVSIREAALKLQEWFPLGGSGSTASMNEKTKAPDGAAGDQGGRALKPCRRTPNQTSPGATSSLPENLNSSSPAPATNPPLSFTLKSIDPTHPYLANRGISRGIAEYFGVGYFAGKGSMHGRIVIPIHDEEERLVAYAGRSIDDSEPRYKLPNGFHKNLVLFNLHRVLRAGDDANGRVIVVEGFFDTMKVVQAGFLNVVALMGTTLSETQEQLLAPFKEVILMLDGDDTGRHASAESAARLARFHFVRIVDLDGQPDELSSDQIQAILGNL